MFQVKRFVCNMLAENCYVVSDESRDCVIIDPGTYYEEERTAVVNYITDNRLTPRHLLLTHGHLDHNFGDNTIYEKYGLKPEVSEGDAKLMENLGQQAERFYQLKLNYKMPPVGRFYATDDIIRFGHHALKVIPTPGHSRGSVCLYCEAEHVIFTGDTLFHRSVGRTDLGGGSMLQIIQSLRTLAQLPDETIVLPGHGDKTTIGDEIAHNPYIDR